ncbi:MAG: MFS transporter, partial [Candidatus Thorarchaeota archaeon]|nr:MFS transporter [Candidatus Thorarchaeota archaeon]
AAGTPGVSKGYMIFLVVLMGLISNLDSWLSLIESKALTGILRDFWGITTASTAGEVTAAQSEFAFLQGIFGIIVFGVFFIAWFADAYGRKKGMMLLVLVMGIPAILIVFLSINIYMFLLLYSVVIMGTTSNLWEVPVSEEAPAKSRGMLGSAAFMIGVIPLYAIIGPMIIDAYGWQWGYGVMFFLMVVLLILLFFMKEPQRWVDSKDARGEGRLGILSAVKKIRKEDYKYIVIATTVYLTWTISFKMVTTFGGSYFVNVQGLTEGEFNSILTIAGLLLPVSALISGILLDKVGRNVVLILGSLGSIGTLVGLALTGMPLFYQLAYFFMAMLLAWIYVYIVEIFPNEVRSTSVGVCITGARLGYVVGPLLSSVLIALVADMVGLWMFAGLLLIIPLFTLLAKPLETKGKTLEEIEVER